MPTFALNFSRPGAQVVAQYYNFLRLGFEGYRRVQQYARDVATRLAAQIEELGPFELLTRGDELPVFAFTLKTDVENYTVFDVSNALRERGWQVPAYTFPENRTDLAALRVVVRRGFTHDMADLLLADLQAAAAAARAAAGADPRRDDRDRVRALGVVVDGNRDGRVAQRGAAAWRPRPLGADPGRGGREPESGGRQRRAPPSIGEHFDAPRRPRSTSSPSATPASASPPRCSTSARSATATGASCCSCSAWR